MVQSAKFLLMKEDEKRIHSSVRLFAKENRVLSWLHLWVVILCLSGCYFVLWINSYLLVSFLTSMLLSLLLVRFFVIYHDYVHKSILQKSVIARFVFTIFGLYILAPVSIWNRSHNHHHQHNSKLNTSGIGSFPILTRNAYLGLSPFERLSYRVIRHPITILLAYFFTFMYGMCIQNVLNNFSKHGDALLALVFHFGIGISVFFYGGLGLFIFSILMPALISSCLGSYLFYVQHNYPGVVHHQRENWSYFKAAIVSSGYISMNPVMEWFTANIGYHHIHHLNPAIPFYNLPKAYRAIPELKIKSDTSLHPAEIVKCLKLTFWDPTKNRMAGMKD